MISMNLKVSCAQYEYEICVCVRVAHMYVVCLYVKLAAYWSNFPICWGMGSFGEPSEETKQWTYHVAWLNMLWDLETKSEPLVYGFTFLIGKCSP